MIEKYFKFHASLGWANDNRYEVHKFDFADDLTEEEIGKRVQEEYEVWLNNILDAGWWEIDRNGNDL